jgi:U4/U6 small nuclear ribonucleoprotein PRP3
VQVFRVNNLQDGRHIYKVDINATENRLTGVCVTTRTGTNVVVVEGDRKGMRRFNRLMMHRIDWNPMVNLDGADDSMFEEPNKCYLVWQGMVARPAFQDFRVHKFINGHEARNFMGEIGVVQYWDAAQFFVPTGDDVAT